MNTHREITGMDTIIRKVLLGTSLAALIFTTGMARADDTDVYMNPGAGLPAGGEPMVMFSLDYRPNLGATACNGDVCDTLIAEGYMPVKSSYVFFDVLKGALKKVMDPLEGVRVGLMLNHDNNNNCEVYGRTACSNGGYIAMCFKSYEATDSNNPKSRFNSKL
jgi:type IV pilus assembly protein PilY1